MLVGGKSKKIPKTALKKPEKKQKNREKRTKRCPAAWEEGRGKAELRRLLVSSGHVPESHWVFSVTVDGQIST